MGLRTVRLDAEEEQALEEIRAITGAPVSQVLKQGLFAVRATLRRRVSSRPYEIFRKLDLGPGGYAAFPARRAKEGIGKLLDQKRQK